MIGEVIGHSRKLLGTLLTATASLAGTLELRYYFFFPKAENQQRQLMSGLADLVCCLFV